MSVLFEKSPEAFHAYPETYYHHFTQKSDTGLKLSLLQEYVFLPLDIFRNIYHNSGIRSKREAWLAFFSLEEPQAIIDLISAYPEFKPMYEQVYAICRNVENIMGIFSEELRELDRNTVQYMMDEMQAEIDRQKAMIDQKNTVIEQKDRLLQEAFQRIYELEQGNK